MRSVSFLMSGCHGAVCLNAIAISYVSTVSHPGYGGKYGEQYSSAPSMDSKIMQLTPARILCYLLR